MVKRTFKIVNLRKEICMAKDVLYLKIAKSVTEQIKSETLQFGDRLPSLRSAQKL
jgi:DNA-binding transcriptional regulator YhcF (GntR family)